MSKLKKCLYLINLLERKATLQNTIGNKVKLGKIVNALGFKHKEHSHVAYYEVVPLRAA